MKLELDAYLAGDLFDVLDRDLATRSLDLAELVRPVF